MKKSHKILIILAVIAVIIAALVWWQFGNIKAIYYWARYSDADIETMLENNFGEVGEYLEKNPEIGVRPTKPVEEELHKEGIIDDEELSNLITEKTTVKDIFGTDIDLDDDKSFTNTENGEKLEVEDINKLKEENKDNQKPAPEQESNEAQSDINAQISECVAQMYVLKSTFVSQLDAIYDTAFAEYKAVWKSLTEDERMAKKKELLTRVYPQAAALEKECDAKVNEIVTKLRSLLEEAGQDTSLADKIYESYQNEKSLKKAHYINIITN